MTAAAALGLTLAATAATPASAKTTPRPARPATPTRPARPATPTRPTRPARPTRPTRPAKPTEPAKPATPVVLDCLTKPQVEPHAFVLTCADANSALTGLSWTSWTPRLASATGTLTQNDCVPDCAAGHFRSYPALVVLWAPVGYPHGKRFSELTMIFPGARPPVFNGLDWVPGPRTATSALSGSVTPRN